MHSLCLGIIIGIGAFGTNNLALIPSFVLIVLIGCLSVDAAAAAAAAASIASL